jgi:hypothetical protein
MINPTIKILIVWSCLLIMIEAIVTDDNKIGFPRIRSYNFLRSETFIRCNEPTPVHALLSPIVLKATAIERFNSYPEPNQYSVIFQVDEILKYETNKTEFNISPKQQQDESGDVDEDEEGDGDGDGDGQINLNSFIAIKNFNLNYTQSLITNECDSIYDTNIELNQKYYLFLDIPNGQYNYFTHPLVTRKRTKTFKQRPLNSPQYLNKGSIDFNFKRFIHSSPNVDNNVEPIRLTVFVRIPILDLFNSKPISSKEIDQNELKDRIDDVLLCDNCCELFFSFIHLFIDLKVIEFLI